MGYSVLSREGIGNCLARVGQARLKFPISGSQHFPPSVGGKLRRREFFRFTIMMRSFEGFVEVKNWAKSQRHERRY